MEEYLGALGIFQAIGVIGFLVYLYAFGSVQFEWIDGNSATYSALNVLAASLVAISLVVEFNLSSALIQGSWIIIGLVGILKRNSSKVIHSNTSPSKSHTRDLA